MTWRSFDAAKSQADAGLGRLPAKVANMSIDEAWALLESPQTQRALLRFLAVLGAWRTLTAQQIEALSGSRGTSNCMSKLMVAAFRADILELGSTAAGLTRAASSNSGTLYRPSQSTAVNRILDALTYPEWVSLTGGSGWDQGGQFDRHNILATEVGLRIAEYAKVATVLGEKFSTIDLLAGAGIGARPLTGDTRSADLTIVRPDGMKIAVEVTASTSNHFVRKVERWAEVLNERSMNDSGLAVIFLIAPPLDASGSSVRNATYKAVANVVRRHPGTVSNSIATRIGVATWTDWFPGRHKISTAFHQLEVDMAAGVEAGSMKWRRVQVLNRVDYPYAPSRPELTAILDNAHLLWSTPVWLRDHQRAPTLIPTILNLARVHPSIPFPEHLATSANEKVDEPPRPDPKTINMASRFRPYM